MHCLCYRHSIGTMSLKLTIVVLTCYIIIVQARQCLTPNQEAGQCISLFSCPILLESLSTSKNSAVEFVRLSSCGSNATDPFVCCGSSTSFIETKKPNFNGSDSTLLTERRYCGLQHVDDYERTSDTTGITEFPWMARLEYVSRSQGTRQFLCSGTLIARRYVLTLARCINDTRTLGAPIGVQLGEYNVHNDTDCVHESGLDECSAPVEDYGIEKFIVHPNFIMEGNREYDIALIRLNQNVEYSDYIRPICLPFPDTKQPQIGDLLTSSGWGLHPNGSLATVKKRTTGTLISNAECAAKWKVLHTIHISEKHLCSEVDSNSRDVPCRGDSGGPVMSTYKSQWFQQGIISIGSRNCGEYPTINTRVASFVEWIQENVEP